jgi:hypothetical protein
LWFESDGVLDFRESSATAVDFPAYWPDSWEELEILPLLDISISLKTVGINRDA